MARDLTTILTRLIDADIEFILVGGLAAVLHGAPTATFDVDIVPDRSPENAERLARLLAELGARYRGYPNADLRPGPEDLAGEGHQLLVTDLGAVDILGTVEGGHGYAELLDRARLFDVDGRHVRVLNLDALIEIKRALGRDKDRAVLEILEETLRRSGG